MLMRERHRLVLAAAAIVAMTAAAYAPVSQNGSVWDDQQYVVANTHLQDLGGLSNMWFKWGTVPQYYPVTFSSFWIEYQLFGLDLWHYHWHNVALHAINAVLLFVLLRKLGLSDIAAWLAAAIFALHPVHVETAAWISERKNLLSLFFYLLAALAYFQFREKGRWWYAAALVLFVLALLSKSVAVSLPAALLLVIYWRRGRITRGDVMPLLPFVGAGVAMGLVTVYMEHEYVGAQGADWAFSLVDRCLIAGRALVFYVSKLFWPANLTFIYPRWRIDAGAWPQFLYPLTVIAVVIALWLKRRRLGRGPLVAVLFFAGTLTPALGFIDFYPMRFSFVADHFQYAASLGLIVLVTAIASRYRAGVILLLAVLPFLGWLTWSQTHMYRSDETVWRWTVEPDRNPECWMAWNNLGGCLFDRNENEEAIACFRKCVRLKPDHYRAIFNIAESLGRLNRLPQAVEEYRNCLAVRGDFAPALVGLGKVRFFQKQYVQAAEHLRQAVELRPDDAMAWYFLGVVRLRQDRAQEAIEHLNKAIDINDRRPSTFLALEQAHAKLGQHDLAAAAKRQAEQRRKP